ncbi:PAS domain-containing sensor histidine kinase [Aneurinibacillus sp. REN35]|uniref:PAS domain-containing sensor histidine kinase n=1 Tax=Aneurinibacillus sp. REN35 TaxID=3237286 RepID=UPI0035273A0B
MLEHTLFQTLTDGVLIMDAKRKILEMNPAASKMTGWTIGQTVPYCVYCQKRKLVPGEERCLMTGKNAPTYFESDMPTLQGETIPVSFSTAHLPSENDTDRQIVLMLRDLSQKRKEEELQMAKLMARQTIEAQEAERKRLAQELHDGIGQSLYSISMALGLLRQDIGEHKVDLLDNITATLQTTMKEVKRLSVALRPPALDILGLKAALLSLARQVEMHFPLTVTIHYHLPAELHLSSSTELNIYRILQETLSNAAKHAGAATVSIYLEQMNATDDLRLTVCDDGIGFDLSHVHKQSEGLGLRHIAERARLLEGRVDIHTAPQSGTTVQVTIPYAERGEHTGEKSYDFIN